MKMYNRKYKFETNKVPEMVTINHIKFRELFPEIYCSV